MNIQIFTVPFITSTKFSAEILQSNLHHQNVFMCNRILEKPLWSTEKNGDWECGLGPGIFFFEFSGKNAGFCAFFLRKTTCGRKSVQRA